MNNSLLLWRVFFSLEGLGRRIHQFPPRTSQEVQTQQPNWWFCRRAKNAGSTNTWPDLTEDHRSPLIFLMYSAITDRRVDSVFAWRQELISTSSDALFSRKETFFLASRGFKRLRRHNRAVAHFHTMTEQRRWLPCVWVTQTTNVWSCKVLGGSGCDISSQQNYSEGLFITAKIESYQNMLRAQFPPALTPSLTVYDSDSHPHSEY